MNTHETFLDKNYPIRYTGADFILRQAETRFISSLDMTKTKVIFGERHSGRKNYEQEMKKCLS